MATDKQIAANRANALSSTGPRSLAGKARSSRNAMSHGLTAKQPLLPGESAEEASGLRRAIFSSLSPQGALENQLVEQIVRSLWRLSCVAAIEMALFEWAAHYQAQCYDAPIETAEGLLRNDPTALPTPDLQDSLTFGRMFEVLLSEGVTEKLGRYETMLQRQVSQGLKDLRDMQAPRRKIDEELSKPPEKRTARHGQLAGEMDHRHYAELDRQRMLRMDPP